MRHAEFRAGVEGGPYTGVTGSGLDGEAERLRGRSRVVFDLRTKGREILRNVLPS